MGAAAAVQSGFWWTQMRQAFVAHSHDLDIIDWVCVLRWPPPGFEY